MSNLATLVFLNLYYHAEELWVSSLCDLPQTLPARSLVHFGKVIKHHIQSFALLPVFLLELSEHEDHVSGAPVGSEATLALWELVFCCGRHQPVQEDSSEYFSCNGEQSYPLIVGVIRLFPFVVVQGYDYCIVEILW